MLDAQAEQAGETSARVEEMFSNRRYPGERRFPGVAMVGVVESATERAGQVEHETRWYLCSAKLDAGTSTCAVCDH